MKSNIKIACLDSATLGGYDLSKFGEFGEFVQYDLTPPDKVIERLKGVDVAVVNKVVLDKAVLDASNLKLILLTATGMNNIDLAHAKALGIVVKNAAGYSTKSVIQHTFALIFAFLNQIIYYDKFSKEKRWCESAIFSDFSTSVNSLENKTHGIIGLGEIGRGVAKISQAFGANVMYYSTSGANNDANFKQVGLEELLKNSDIISIHAPLNEKTKNLLTYANLSLIKENALLINVGRGGIINEMDLAKIIDERDIRVGLDVLETEPMIKNHPLLSVRKKHNLIITPHIAWASKEAVSRLVDVVLNNLKEWVENGK